MRRRTNRQKLRQSLHHSQNHTQQVIVHAFSPGSTGFSLSSWVSLAFVAQPFLAVLLSLSSLRTLRPLRTLRYLFLLFLSLHSLARSVHPTDRSPLFSSFYFPFSNFFLISYASIFPK